MYSASVLDRATEVCFDDFQLMGTPLIKRRCPWIDLLSSGSSPQLLSVYAFKINDLGALLYKISSSFVSFR
jgi:hypothetical protein